MALIDYIVRGIKKLAYIVFFLGKTVTAGGETWQEAITQVLDVALIFEFSFLYTLFRTLIIVSAFTQPSIW